MKMTATVILTGLVVIAMGIGPVCASEAEFPTKPIHIWVGWAPGGPTDTLVRTVAPVVEKILGQPVVVENRPGGTGALAMGLLKSAKPDGYTLGATSDTPFTRIPHTIEVKYNSLEDFTYLISLGRSRNGMVVKSDSPLKTFRDLVEFARKNPGQLTHGTPGVGNTTHLAMERIAQIEKIKIQHIYFQGAAPIMNAVLGGHVMCASALAGAWVSHVKAGTLRPLLIYDPPEGIKQWPEVPSLKKLGYGFDVPLFEPIIAAPKGVPKVITDKLIAVFAEGIKTAAFENTAATFEVALAEKPLAGEDLAKIVRTQFQFYGQLIKELGLDKK
jgi:tripartite-type tricarboxylate transporter receptor subunit TctC